jgi:GNAT superfamily N-acetyltransferase
VTVRELGADETALAAAALLELRTGFADSAAIVAAADAQRADGYRVVASFEDGADDAAAAAGFRLGDNLAWGHHLYVDDLSCRAACRGRGHAGALMRWLLDEAQRAGCTQLHLDSGVQRERAHAHRLYLRSGLWISSHHFQAEISQSSES